jgi:hypothetical protein
MTRGHALDDHAAVALARTASTPLLTAQRPADTVSGPMPVNAADPTRPDVFRAGST